MKISLDWLKQYIDLSESPDEIARILTGTGLEVEGIESYASVKGGLEGLVIGKVISCEKHPNADRLKVTKVDIGNQKTPQIICGANNVEAGQKVVVAPVGTTLHPTKGDPFTINKAKIRGEYSEGMICSEDEVGLGTDHDGIIVLDTDLPTGTDVRKHFNIYTDNIFEIDLTPNRGDATSHIGVARDLKAILNREIQWPDISNFKVDNHDLDISVEIKNSDACPRYSGLTITGIEVMESPEWLKNRLKSIGLAPINNVVDITNFVCHEMGQPLHAFDADKIKSGKVVVQTLKKSTVFTTLDEEKKELNDFDLMICDQDQGMCIAGVFGGIDSGVTSSTKNIFLESAYFSPDYIRRTAQYHGLKTDASFRFERGTDPNLTVTALKRAALLIKEIAGGSISSEIIDQYPNKIKDFKVPVRFTQVNRLIGIKIKPDDIYQTLERLDIQTKDKTNKGFLAIVPSYRSDVTREADVIEEIIRIYGYDKVEIPANFSVASVAEFPLVYAENLLDKISRYLTDNGFFEIWTNSLTKPEYSELHPELNSSDSVEILNKLSEDLGVLRQSMLFSGLEIIRYNINHKQSTLKFFEFGKIYKKAKEGYREERGLSLFITGNKESPSWIKSSEKVQFYDLAGLVYPLLEMLGIHSIKIEKLKEALFVNGAKIKSGDKQLGKLGKVNPAIAKNLDIGQEIFYAELDWDLLLKITNDNIVAQEIPKFPEVKRDLSLVLDKNVTFAQIEAIARAEGTDLIKDLNVFDVYEGDKIEPEKKAYAITFTLQDPEKTLTDNLIDHTMNKLMEAFQKKLGAIIRK